MTADKENFIGEVFVLLREWCDTLLQLQIDLPVYPALHGAILCPACKTVHGRCHEAVYPLMYMARATGEEKYLTAARRLFSWGENMLCSDGAVRNDAKSEWKGVTVFAAVALHDALKHYGGMLTAEEKAAWERRLQGMGEWLYRNLRPEMPAYINYYAANACAMAQLGDYFDRADYRALAASLAAYCFASVTENQLIYGEGRPADAVTPKGCRAIDPGGYNAEETLPMLCKYAAVSGDNKALAACRRLLYAHLLWMLPDGAWDDSVGTRCFKWTYWGSRTADGCQEALFALGKQDPVFAEAALRNLRLYRRCTHGGLLYGGPDYALHHEQPCVHHTFCRAKTLASALENGIPAWERCALPSEYAPAVGYYPEMDTCRVTFGGWLADITGYDFPCQSGRHASGGAISSLWHNKVGPVIAAGAVDDVLREPHNQQISVKPEDTRCTCPRIEAEIGGVPYGQHLDHTARITRSASSYSVVVKVNACLCRADHTALSEYGECSLEYVFAPDVLTIRGSVYGEIAQNAYYILPVIANSVKAIPLRGSMAGDGTPMFHLNPGFKCREYRIRPDSDGIFTVRLEPSEERADHVV